MEKNRGFETEKESKGKKGKMEKTEYRRYVEGIMELILSESERFSYLHP